MGVLVAGFVSAWGTANSEELARYLSLGLEPSQKKILPGEAVLLSLSLRNTGKRDLHFVFLSEEALRLEIRDTFGRIVQEGSGHIQQASKVGLSQIDRVSPSAVLERNLILNGWCSTRLPAGKYVVVLQIKPWLPFPELNDADEWPLPVSTEMAEARCDLEILQPDEQAAEQILSALAEKAVTDYHSIERIWAAEMLAYSEFPTAVRYLARIAVDSDARYARRFVIRGLGRSRTPEAAEAAATLIPLYEDASLDPYLRHVALGAIYRLRHSNDPDVLRAIEPILEKRNLHLDDDKKRDRVFDSIIN